MDTTKPSRSYTSASKSAVKTVGEKKFDVGLETGKTVTTSWEVADVHRPLCSVSRMAKNGYHARFAPESTFAKRFCG